MAVCSSWSEYLLIRIVVISFFLTVFALGFILREQYHYDETIHSDQVNEDACSYMRLHILCGNIGLVVLPTFACITYRMFCIFSPKPLTILHGITAVLAVPFIVVTYITGTYFDSVTYYNEMKLYKSGHSSLGMFFIVIYCITVASVGILFSKFREKFGNTHSILGGGLLICGAIAALSGCECRRYLYINIVDDEERRRYYTHSTALHVYEISVVILTIFVLVLIGLKSMKNISTIIYPDESW